MEKLNLEILFNLIFLKLTLKQFINLNFLFFISKHGKLVKKILLIRFIGYYRCEFCLLLSKISIFVKSVILFLQFAL